MPTSSADTWHYRSSIEQCNCHAQQAEQKVWKLRTEHKEHDSKGSRVMQFHGHGPLEGAHVLTPVADDPTRTSQPRPVTHSATCHPQHHPDQEPQIIDVWLCEGCFWAQQAGCSQSSGNFPNGA